jgi:hypothetical protein
MFLIIATEPKEHSASYSYVLLYLLLYTIIIKEKLAKLKKGKIVCFAKKTYTFILNRKKYSFALKFVNLVDSNSKEANNVDFKEDDYYNK